jgi:hypothetical protein
MLTPGCRTGARLFSRLTALAFGATASKLVFLSGDGAHATAKPKNPGAANRNDAESGSSIDAT